MSALRQETITPDTQYSDRDYFALPEGAPYQLIGGKLVMVPAPSPYHQRISKRLLWLFVNYVEKQHQMGEVYAAPIDVHLGERDVFQPDLLVVGSEQKEIVGENRIEAAPALVIEILSPSTAYYDLRHKKKVYAHHGVSEYWVVDPIEASIEIYQNTDEEFTLTTRAEKEGTVASHYLVGLEVLLSEVFD